MKCLPSVQLVHTMCEKKAHAFIFSRTKKPSLSSEFASRALLFHVAPQCGHFLSIHGFKVSSFSLDVFLLLRFRFPGLCGHMYKHWRNNCCILFIFPIPARLFRKFYEPLQEYCIFPYHYLDEISAFYPCDNSSHTVCSFMDPN